jgi:mannosyltransferase OCH1-like enzyme
VIPRIIHQTAPKSKIDWHPMWFKCQDSWKNHYNGFQYILWNDDDIHSLIEKYYPQYFELYCSFPIHILKIDFSRFCILDHMGGIYADMDMFCYINFYNELTKNAYVVQSIKDEFIENSLMAGIPDNKFFQQCMKTSVERFNHAKRNHHLFDYMIKIHNNFRELAGAKSFLIFYIAGTNLVSNVFRKFDKNYVDSLSGWRYNNVQFAYDKEFRTKHMHTCSWGDEDIRKTKFLATEKGLSFDEHLKHEYKQMRFIDIDNFDFYADYSKGTYIKEDPMDLGYNDYAEEIFNFDTIYT